MAWRIVVYPESDLDIQAATVWYEDQQSGVGTQFLDKTYAITYVIYSLFNNEGVL